MSTDVSPFAGKSKDQIEVLMGFISALAPGMREIVDAIEKGPALTQDRYDAYMAAIALLCKDTETKDKSPQHLQVYQTALGLAMAKAGGNRRGIFAALKAMGVPL